MPKQKVSVTLTVERLREAKAVTGNSNTSELLDQALDALIERELERQWLLAHGAGATPAGLPEDVPVDLSELPWEDR